MPGKRKPGPKPEQVVPDGRSRIPTPPLPFLGSFCAHHLDADDSSTVHGREILEAYKSWVAVLDEVVISTEDKTRALQIKQTAFTRQILLFP